MTYMTKSEYAKHRGVSEACISKYLKRGKIKATPKGRINVERADDKLNQLSNSQPLLKTKAVPAKKTKATKSNEDFWELKKQKEQVLLDKARMEFEIKMGLYVRIADVNRALFARGQIMKSELFNMIRRTTPQLEGKNLQERNNILETELNKALQDLTSEVKLDD